MATNGPLLLAGPFTLAGSGAGDTVSGDKAALCRCGASANKPFCDGSHVAVGFEAG
ncbi:MAG: CDGSH iron-sulfur domain-containing protein [Acidobacteriota bacterium]|nr:CDGSH iron-sulfur domain-containing protein [Acidobacteriota bacterium]